VRVEEVEWQGVLEGRSGGVAALQMRRDCRALQSRRRLLVLNAADAIGRPLAGERAFAGEWALTELGALARERTFAGVGTLARVRAFPELRAFAQGRARKILAFGEGRTLERLALAQGGALNGRAPAQAGHGADDRSFARSHPLGGGLLGEARRIERGGIAGKPEHDARKAT